MEVYCTDTDGEELIIWVHHKGEDADDGIGIAGSNPHQSWIERWTDDYFFQLNYQHGGLQMEDHGLPFSWTAFQVDLNTMEFTHRMLWNSEIYMEQEGTCSVINVERV